MYFYAFYILTGFGQKIYLSKFLTNSIFSTKYAGHVCGLLNPPSRRGLRHKHHPHHQFEARIRKENGTVDLSLRHLHHLSITSFPILFHSQRYAILLQHLDVPSMDTLHHHKRLWMGLDLFTLYRIERPDEIGRSGTPEGE